MSPTSPRDPRCPSAASIAASPSCVSLEDAEAFCGKGATWKEGGCRARKCGRDEALDIASGACAPLRALSEKQGIALLEDEVLACPNEGSLVVADGMATCIARDAACGRGGYLRGDGACDPLPSCEKGAVRDLTRHRCTPVLARGGEGEILDVGTWTRIVFGADGGAASPYLCAAIARRPGVFGLPPRGTTTLRIAIDMTFPDNDLSQARARAIATDAAGAPLMGTAAVALLDAAIGALVTPLRRVRGVANASSATTSVRCVVRNVASPQAAPRRDPEAEKSP